MNKVPEIEFVDPPGDLMSRYQYFTEADIRKLCEIGYARPFTELEHGVNQYVSNFLLKEACY